MENDLKKLLVIYPQAVRSLAEWDNEINLKAIEDNLIEVRNQREPFSEEHYNFIEDKQQKYWYIAKYVKFPLWDPKSFPKMSNVISNYLEKAKNSNDGKTKDNNETNCISEMLKIISDLEVVSTILRFVDPNNFGRLSASVEKVLEVKRGAEKVIIYKNYLKDLAKIKEKYQFKSMAHVDMALYAYAFLSSLSRKKSKKKGEIPEKDRIIWEEYKDLWAYHEESVSSIKKIRAGNLLSEIWKDDDLYMAELLFDKLLKEKTYKASGLFYAILFEDYVKKLCEMKIAAPRKGKICRRRLEKLINDSQYFNAEQKNKFHEARIIRNLLFHQNEINNKQVEDLRNSVIELKNIIENKDNEI
jgi:hypothetical protein